MKSKKGSWGVKERKKDAAVKKREEEKNKKTKG